MTGRLVYLTGPSQEVPDGAGGSTIIEGKTREWWCHRRDKGGKEEFGQGVEHLAWDVEFRGPWIELDKPKANWSLRHEGDEYDIKRVSESMRARFEIVVLAERNE